MISVSIFNPMKKKIEDLKPLPEQSKIYSVLSEDVISLSENIKEVGQLEPAIITKDNVLLSGYTRCEALKLLGRKTIECRVIDVPPEDRLFYLISANKQRIKDMVCRVSEIEHLDRYLRKGKGRRSDLLDQTTGQVDGRRPQTDELIGKILGISKDSVHKLRYIKKHNEDVIKYIGTHITLASCYSQVRMWVNQSEVIEKKKQTRKIKYSGQGYTLYKKDAKTLNKTLKSESVDHILFSPPYYQQRTFYDHKKEIGQEETVDKYIDNMIEIIGQCEEVLRKTGTLFINVGETMKNSVRLQIPERISIAISDRTGLKLRNSLVWDKYSSASPESTKRRWHHQYEMVYFFVKDTKSYWFDIDQIRVPYRSKSPVETKAPRHYSSLQQGVHPRWVMRSTHKEKSDGVGFDLSQTAMSVSSSIKHPLGKPRGDVLQIANSKKIEKLTDVEHTGRFPVDLVRQLLRPVSQIGDIVLDPFTGSSTTGVVALEQGCEFIGFDINETFIDLSQKRLEKTIDDIKLSERME